MTKKQKQYNGAKAVFNNNAETIRYTNTGRSLLAKEVRIPGFHCWDWGSKPGLGTEIPQAIWPKQSILDTDLTSYMKINSKSITNINARYKRYKSSQKDNMGENLKTMGVTGFFLRYNTKGTIHQRNEW